jgi:xanthine/CO dehydrogenase XdhC/CoxF family maturation factor
MRVRRSETVVVSAPMRTELLSLMAMIQVFFAPSGKSFGFVSATAPRGLDVWTGVRAARRVNLARRGAAVKGVARASSRSGLEVPVTDETPAQASRHGWEPRYSSVAMTGA